jgi:short subunit dehydrogenase-like uncharacterized protein
MISTHDTKARETGACIVCHCGNDCIPSDLTVYEMNEYAKSKGMSLLEAQTYAEYGDGASWSGGTLATAAYQLGKDRTNTDKTNFDPLYTSVRKTQFCVLKVVLLKRSTHPNLPFQTSPQADGSKSEHATKNVSPKKTVKVAELNKSVGPWVMAPVSKLHQVKL